MKFNFKEASYELFKKWREKSDVKYKNEMICTIKNASDDELTALNKEFYNGIDFDNRIGRKIHKVSLEVDSLINTEMERRGLRTCDDIEEEIWFSQHGYGG